MQHSSHPSIFWCIAKQFVLLQRGSLPWEATATNTVAEEVRLVGAAWSKQEKVQESIPVSIHNEKETAFSGHNYNVLEPVHPDMDERTFARAAESLASSLAFLTAKSDCSSPLVPLPWSILLRNIINAAAPLREKPMWIHHTGPVPRCQALLSLTANILSQPDFSLKRIVMGSHCAYPRFSTQGLLFNLSGNL